MAIDLEVNEVEVKVLTSLASVTRITDQEYIDPLSLPRQSLQMMSSIDSNMHSIVDENCPGRLLTTQPPTTPRWTSRMKIQDMLRHVASSLRAYFFHDRFLPLHLHYLICRWVFIQHCGYLICW